MQLVPEHGLCFVCGTQNPHGLGIRWYLKDDNTLYGEVTLNEYQQGPPQHVHGGASAAILDDAMGTVVWQNGHMVVAAGIDIRFHQPIPLGAPLRIQARVTNINGRKIHAAAEILLPDDTIGASGTGLFIEARHLFADYLGSSWQMHPPAQED